MADPIFPLTIDDTSPLVLFTPFADTFSQPQTSQGWNPYYTGTGFATVDSGAGSPVDSAIGNGTSLHITAADGAALQITWNGTSTVMSRKICLPPYLRADAVCVRVSPCGARGWPARALVRAHRRDRRAASA